MHRGELEKVQRLIQDDYIVSGHLTRLSFLEITGKMGVQPEFYASFRHPVSQLLSQLNWQLETGLKGVSFLASHPKSSLDVIKKIIFCDHSDPDAVLDAIDQHPGYFLNNQSTFLIGNLDSRRLGHRDASPEVLISRVFAALNTLACGYAEDQYDELIKQLIKTGICDETREAQVTAADSNKSRNFFSYSDERKSQYFLKELGNRQFLDCKLYEQLVPSEIIAIRNRNLHEYIQKPLNGECKALVESARQTFVTVEAQQAQA